MEKLRDLRMRNRLTCQEMSDALGISKTFYWQIEHDQRRLSYQMAFNLAKIFELRPDDIFYDEFDSKVA